MDFDTPLVEYLIIGAHTASWLFLSIFAVFGIPLSIFTSSDFTAVFLLLLLPFFYLLGMTCDSVVHYPLDPFRRKIRDSMFEYEKYKDEFIAFESPELYSAYEVRVRRVRIIGAAIFNWPLLGISLLPYIDFTRLIQPTVVIVGTVIMCLVSTTVWRGLYRRAYKFRKNACEVIRARSSE